MLQKFSGNCWIANHSTEHSRNSGKKFPKFWLYLVRSSSFWKFWENAFPFATRSCRNFKPDVLVDWKAPKVYCSNATVFHFSVFLLFIVNANMIVYFLTLCNTDDNCAEPIKCPFLKMLYTHIENIKKKMWGAFPTETVNLLLKFPVFYYLLSILIFILVLILSV